MRNRRLVSAISLTLIFVSGACGSDAKEDGGTVAPVAAPGAGYVRVSSLAGQVESRGDALDGTYDFIIVSDGSYRFERLDKKQLMAFNATTGVLTSVDGRGDLATLIVSSGRVPAGPDSRRAVESKLLGWGYRSSALHKTPTGTPVTEAGRSARLVTATFRGLIDRSSEAENKPLGEISAEAVFDDATGLPLRLSERVGGVSRSSVTVTSLQTNVQVPANIFRPDISSLKVDYRGENDLGFRPVGADIATKDPRFAKVRVPSGYSDVTYHLSRGPTRTYVGTDIATTIYRNGIDTIVITSRMSDKDADPYDGGNSDLFGGDATSVPVDGPGGKPWNYVSGIGVTPHVWGRLDNGRLVSVGGDVDLDELQLIVEQL